MWGGHSRPPLLLLKLVVTLKMSVETGKKTKSKASHKGCPELAEESVRPTPVHTKYKKDSPEPPRLSLKPSRLEGQLDDPTVLPGCCNGIAEP
jgi:hypothetical protein